MAWGAQGVFALPCGSSGGAESYGITLGIAAWTQIDEFEPIGDLELEVTVSQSREVSIILTGSVSNNTALARSEFDVSIDGVRALSVCTVFSPAGEDPSTVAVTAHGTLSPGTHYIRGLWRLQTADPPTQVNASIGALHLEAIVAQAVP